MTSEGGVLPLMSIKEGALPAGTMPAILHNIQRYNAGERGAVEESLKAAVPELVKAGVFDLFPAEEWAGSHNKGRQFVGEAARKFMEAEKKFVFPRFFMI